MIDSPKHQLLWDSNPRPPKHHSEALTASPQGSHPGIVLKMYSTLGQDRRQQLWQTASSVEMPWRGAITLYSVQSVPPGTEVSRASSDFKVYVFSGYFRFLAPWARVPLRPLGKFIFYPAHYLYCKN